jgi:hypothetical protein
MADFLYKGLVWHHEEHEGHEEGGEGRSNAGKRK